MIWKMAMREQRLVRLYARHCGLYAKMDRNERRRKLRRDVSRRGRRKVKYGRYMYQKVPSFFFVSHEARHEALLHYTIRFQVCNGECMATEFRPAPPDNL
jgi:hypothetical protein